MDFNDLTEEQKAKARECKTADELVKLAKEEGIDLDDAALGIVSNDVSEWDIPCHEVC